MKREDAMKLVDEGLNALNAALRAGRSETLERFLATLARFHAYSFRNAMLIALQKPDATYVAGFHAWKKLGRYVRKGEQGIAIFAPMVFRKKTEQGDHDRKIEEPDALFGFKIAYVFDVTQTDGEPLAEFANATGEPGEWLSRIEDLIRDMGIALEYEFIPNGADGMSAKGRIVVRPDLTSCERFAVLAHELAHEFLHQQTERRKETTRSMRETEAEAVAFTVCRAFNIDSTTRSADYIQLYQGGADTLKESLAVVQETAAHIIGELRSRRELESGTPATTLAA